MQPKAPRLQPAPPLTRNAPLSLRSSRYISRRRKKYHAMTRRRPPGSASRRSASHALGARGRARPTAVHVSLLGGRAAAITPRHKSAAGGRQPGRWFALGWRSARNTGAHAHTRNGSTARGGAGEAQRDTGGITHGHLDLLALRLGGRLRGGHPWREGVALRRGKSRR